MNAQLVQLVLDRGYASASIRRRLPAASPIQRGEEARVAGLERGLELLDPAAVLGQRLAERRGVLDEDVDPDARVRARHSRHVAQRSAGRRKRLVPLDARRAAPG